MPAPRPGPPHAAPSRSAALCTSLCILLCAPPGARAAPGDEHLPAADRKALESFKLTLDLLERASVFHLRVAERLRKEPHARAAALLQLDGGGLAGSVRRMEASPLLAAALKEARLSARDYLMTSLGAITAAMVAALQAGGQRLPQIPEGTNAANIPFLEKEGAAAFERFQSTGALVLEAAKPKQAAKGASVAEPAGETGAAGAPR